MDSVVRIDRGDLRKQQKDEAILLDNPARWVILPIKYPSVWSLFKSHECDFWTAEDMSYTWSWPTGMAAEERTRLLELLCLMSISDSHIFGSLAVWSCSLLEQVQIPEARAFYGFECAFTTIAQETHASIFNAVLREDSPQEDRGRREKLVDTVCAYPDVQQLVEWSNAFMTDAELPFAEKLLVHAIVKCVFNCGACLCGALLSSLFPGLATAYKRTIKTDQLHAVFAVTLYGLLAHPLQPKTVDAHVQLAVQRQAALCLARLPLKTMQVTDQQVVDFVSYVGDTVKMAFGGDVRDPQTNPFRSLMTDPCSSCAMPPRSQYTDATSNTENQATDPNKPSSPSRPAAEQAHLTDLSQEVEEW